MGRHPGQQGGEIGLFIKATAALSKQIGQGEFPQPLVAARFIGYSLLFGTEDRVENNIFKKAGFTRLQQAEQIGKHRVSELHSYTTTNQAV